MLACACLALAALPAAAAAQEPAGAHSDNMSFVKNLPYEARNGDAGRGPNYGTDMEFATLGGRRHAIAGSYENGMQIVDISKPASARIAGVYDCDVLQGDIQVFKQPQRKGRTFATYTADAYGNEESACYTEAEALGFDAVDEEGARGRQGTFIVDITNPAAPRTVSFVEVPQGSHNQTVHPSGNYLYNSNADLMTSFQPAIEVFDISNLAAPVKTGELALPTRPGLGTESHDITFNSEGDRGYSAALSQGVVIDTSDPAKPSVVSSFLDPAINVWHQSDPGEDRRPRVPAGRGRVRRCRRRADLPERRLPRLRHHGRQGEQPREGRGLEHRRGAAHHEPDGHLHRPRVRHPRAAEADDRGVLQRRRPGGRHLGARGHRVREHRHPGRGHEGGRLLPPRRRRHLVGQDPARSRRTATSTSTGTTSPAASTSTSSRAPARSRRRTGAG